MARFLHLADIHLGFDRYDSRERTKDFFLALQDVVERYAIAEAVDFVLIVGDLFEHRTLQPAILNQAQICLQMLQEAGIPVIAIEGNHDNRPYGTKTGWLRYLADWGLLILLEPGDTSQGEPFYSPWDAASRRGSYIDLDCGVRVLGSQWYGTSASKAVIQMAEAIGQLPASDHSTVLLFHHGLEGQIARYQGALRYTDLLPLKLVGVDYLALGHIHKHYAVEGWIFNPGSLEANSVEEAGYERGVYLVEITPHGIRAELKRDYYQRPVVRLKFQATGQEQPEELVERATAVIHQAIAAGQILPDPAPIVELRIEGQVGFDRLDLDLRQLQQQLQQVSGALIFLLRYEADRVEYVARLAEEASRAEIEQEVFTDVLTAHSTYRNRAADLARGLIDLKELHLNDRPTEDLYEFVTDLLMPPNS